MRLSKTNIFLIGIVPIIFGLIIVYNYFISIDKLLPLGLTVSKVHDQLVVIGIAGFLGLSIYWSILVYYIYNIQENELLIQDNFNQLAGSGTKHLENAKGLIEQVLDDIRTSEKLKL
ncbi:MAG: hypothetical protein KKI06_09450 [Euryarchaeota archaeon]|nr:hypothetical protein [Euryarchaeota archaeon]MBU4222496.1 hypothetical protein [Euryarchaeota archaeon]MBU4454109.1 hypothetical protein [Euryarchaeota archaeon]MCG2737326.1 hypothetical protein [Candidatus Methanoperedenaceae archaeon]